MDAGIPMKDIVCASSAGFMDEAAVVDVNHVEESHGGPVVIVALLPKSEQIALLEVNGRLHEDHLDRVMDVALKGCKDVYECLERSVREHVTERASLIRATDV